MFIPQPTESLRRKPTDPYVLAMQEAAKAVNDLLHERDVEFSGVERVRKPGSYEIVIKFKDATAGVADKT